VFKGLMWRFGSNETMIEIVLVILGTVCAFLFAKLRLTDAQLGSLSTELGALREQINRLNDRIYALEKSSGVVVDVVGRLNSRT
jgi:hypothetical protein